MNFEIFWLFMSIRVSYYLNAHNQNNLISINMYKDKKNDGGFLIANLFCDFATCEYIVLKLWFIHRIKIISFECTCYYRSKLVFG